MAVLGAEHPHTLTSMNNLAGTYSDQERWADAVQLQERVVQGRTKVYGQGHSQTVDAMTGLEYFRSGLESQQRSLHESKGSEANLGTTPNPPSDDAAVQHGPELNETDRLADALRASAIDSEASGADGIASTISDDARGKDAQPSLPHTRSDETLT
jgi:hypothetical protein